MSHRRSIYLTHRHGDKGAQQVFKSNCCSHQKKECHTVSVDGSSVSFLPTSLFCHSSVLSPVVEFTPGTTRGMTGELQM